MPSNELPRKELLKLIDAACEGRLDRQQTARLEQVLRDDPVAAALYAQHCELNVELMFAIRGEQALADVRQQIEAEQFADSEAAAMDDGRNPAPTANARPMRRLISFVRRPTPFSMGIAALVVGLLITAMAFMVPPFVRRLSRRPPVAAPAGGIAAELTGLHEAVWAEGALATHRGAFLQTGHGMELRDGFAEVTFRDGTRVVLEAPCTFVVDSENCGRLERGKLTAVAARGFRIQTPGAEIVDWGTEFGVEAGREDQTDVAVFTGAVTIARRAGGTVGQAQKVAAGQSARLRGETITIEPTRADEDRQFTRRLPRPQPTIAAAACDTGRELLVVPGGLVDDAPAHSDEPHQWNGVDAGGIPAELRGLEYVRTANGNRREAAYTIRLKISRPAVLYVFWTAREPPPDWLADDFTLTDLNIGLDAMRGNDPGTIDVGTGKYDVACHVWSRRIEQPGEVVLGPTHKHINAVYGIAVKPLRIP